MSSDKNQNNIVQKLMQNLAEIRCFYAIIAIKHIQCINVRQVPREVLKTLALRLSFQHLPPDLAKVYA